MLLFCFYWQMIKTNLKHRAISLSVKSRSCPIEKWRLHFCWGQDADVSLRNQEVIKRWSIDEALLCKRIMKCVIYGCVKCCELPLELRSRPPSVPWWVHISDASWRQSAFSLVAASSWDWLSFVWLSHEEMPHSLPPPLPHLCGVRLALHCDWSMGKSS